MQVAKPGFRLTRLGCHAISIQFLKSGNLGLGQLAEFPRAESAVRNMFVLPLNKSSSQGRSNKRVGTTAATALRCS